MVLQYASSGVQAGQNYGNQMKLGTHVSPLYVMCATYGTETYGQEALHVACFVSTAD